jgi:hypothetical protein
MFGVEDDKIIRLDKATDVVDTDGEKTVGRREVRERRTAAADEEGFAQMQIAVLVELA